MQIGLAVAIELWLPQFRDPFYSHKANRLRRRLANNPDRPLTVVMLGSSRTAYALQGARLERHLAEELKCPVVAFNFGVPGAGPVTQLLHLRRMLADGIRPDVLLVEVLPPLLGGQRPVPWESHWLHADRLWLDELGLLDRYSFPLKKMREEWWRGWPVPWYSHRFSILSRISPNSLPHQFRQDWGRNDDASGWAPRPIKAPTPEQRRQAVERVRAEYRPYLTGFCLSSPACAALRELLALCRQEGIATTLVLMPEGKEFRSWYTAEAWQQIEAFLQETNRKFGSPILDGRTWVDEGDFSDAHHVLTAGAETFTERLGREIPWPLLEEARSKRAAWALAAGGTTP